MTKSSSLNLNLIFFDMRIEDFYNYIEFMEQSISSKKSYLEKEYEERAKEIDEPETQQEMFEHIFQDELHDLEYTHTFILRKSLFISLYSFMETELKSIATKLEMKNLSNIKIKDISHSGLYQYYFYISTVHNIDLKVSKEILDQFLTYNALRNYFVHNDRSVITTDKWNRYKKLNGIGFRKYPLTDKGDLYHIESLDKGFNIEYLNLISEFFHNLFNSFEENELPI